jgi:hypothetical protein
MQLVDEIHQKTPVLPMEVPDAKATLLLRKKNFFPSN